MQVNQLSCNQCSVEVLFIGVMPVMLISSGLGIHNAGHQNSEHITPKKQNSYFLYLCFSRAVDTVFLRC